MSSSDMGRDVHCLTLSISISSADHVVHQPIGEKSLETEVTDTAHAKLCPAASSVCEDRPRQQHKRE